MTDHKPKPKRKPRKKKEDVSITTNEGYTLTFNDEDNQYISPGKDLTFENGTTSTAGPGYTTSGTLSISEGFINIEEKHTDLRKRYPALELAYNQYRVLLKMAESGPEDLDN
tara:strand:+ start:2883 stop:3218 length:336 start_codon:yes stop_codon:yes gene_type:complete